MYDCPARPADHFVTSFTNNATLPPNQSLLVKAGKGGPDYLYTLLDGYVDAPGGLNGINYSTVFPGHQMAMPAPIVDDVVTYADGAKASREQIAKAITVFVTQTSELELYTRYSLGIKVLGFLVELSVELTVLFYPIKRKLWCCRPLLPILENRGILPLQLPGLEK